MSGDARIAFAQNRLDAARKEIRAAVVDFSITDEKLLELRANAREAFNELRELDRRASKSLLGFLKFW
jgi:hypothetical protein